MKKRLFLIAPLLLFALALTAPPAASQVWYPTNQKAVAWDPVTLDGGAPLPAGSTIEYKVYYKGLIQVEPVLLGQTPNTEYTCSFTNEGKYFVGVQAVRLEAGEIIAEASDISWSDMPDRVANQQTFGFRYYLPPGLAAGLRPK